MEKFVLDTNIFFNMEAGLNLGKSTKAVIENLTKIFNKGKKQGLIRVFMPPRAVEEFLSFFEEKEDFIKPFLSLIDIQSPDVDKIKIPAPVFYRLIGDIRERSYRGLNIGEEEIIKGGKLMLKKTNLSQKEFQIEIGTVIKKFRERYRHATRFGFLDSLTDLDLIFLAKQKNGLLVSSDEGLLRWGRIFGVKELPTSLFLPRVSFLLKKNPSRLGPTG